MAHVHEYSMINNNKLGGNGGEFMVLDLCPWMNGWHGMNYDLNDSKRGCSSSRQVCDGPQCQENDTERTLQNYEEWWHEMDRQDDWTDVDGE